MTEIELLEDALRDTLRRRAAATPVGTGALDLTRHVKVQGDPTTRKRPAVRAAVLVSCAAAFAATVVIMTGVGRQNEERQLSDTPERTSTTSRALVEASPTSTMRLPSPPSELRYLPTELPPGYVFWHMERRPASSSIVDSTTQAWSRSDGARIEFEVSRWAGGDLQGADLTIGPWQLDISEQDQGGGAFSFSDGGELIVDGRFRLIPKSEVIEFIRNLSQRGATANEGFDSPDAAWNFDFDYVGSGEKVAHSLDLRMTAATSFETSYDGRGLQFWAEDRRLTFASGQPSLVAGRDGVEREYYLFEEGITSNVTWEQDGNSFWLSAAMPAEELLRVATSVVPIDKEAWETESLFVVVRLVESRPTYFEASVGDVEVSMLPDDILCGVWRDGPRQCQSARLSAFDSLVVERNGQFEAVGTFRTTGELTTADPTIAIDQVQVGDLKVFRVTLPPSGGLVIDVAGTDLSFTVNQQG